MKAIFMNQLVTDSLSPAPKAVMTTRDQPTSRLTRFHGHGYTRQNGKWRGGTEMHTVLVWVHVGLMMVAFGASPLGRLGLRHLLSRTSGAQAAHAIVRGFSGIFLAGGVAVTVSFCVGLALAWNGGLTQTWMALSIALIVIAGVGGVAIEDRWMKRLTRAEGDAFAIILNERVPLLAALISPILWLCILWLMIERPV